jgi:chromate reductase, NAD(P)H dehydrogenase (quinone)
VIGASLGGLDDPESECMAPRIADIGNRPWFGGRLMVSRAHHVFDEQGAMTDKAVEERGALL